MGITTLKQVAFNGHEKEQLVELPEGSVILGVAPVAAELVVEETDSKVVKTSILRTFKAGEILPDNRGKYVGAFETVIHGLTFVYLAS